MIETLKLRRLSLLGLVAIASGLVGCAAFHEKATPKLTAEIAPGAAHVASPSAKYSVEVRPESGKPQAIEKELGNQMHVQTALEQCGIAKKWPRMDVELHRPLPSGGYHRMRLEFDTQEHRVPPESDYALLPGDRIVVTQDTETVLDDFIKGALSPLGITVPTKKPNPADKYEFRG
jgi:hypothetical protein